MGKRRRHRRCPRVTTGAIRVRVYPVFRRAIEEGAAAGVRRAHKHIEHPDHDAIATAVVEAVLLSIDEVFRFDDEERGA